MPKDQIKIPSENDLTGFKAFEKTTLQSIFETQKPYMEIAKTVLSLLVDIEDIVARVMPLASVNPLKHKSEKPTVNSGGNGAKAVGYQSGKDIKVILAKLGKVSKQGGKITVNKELNGYEQLKDVLEKQIEHKLLSDNNHVILSFIAYFDIYMTKSNVEHEDIKKYINIYAPRLKENVREGTKLSLIQGVKDGTLNIKMDEVDCYVGYIFHSLMSLLSRVSIKHYDTDFQKFDYVQKHIDVILLHLKK